MNLITDTWRGLVQRKLWPVALLLVAAVVAVPLTLAKEPEVEPVPANAVANADEGLPATYVTAAGAEEEAEEGSSKRRRTLGATKDPFEPAPLPKAKKKKKANKQATSSSKSTETSSSKDDGGSKTSGGGGGGGGSSSAPITPDVTPTPTATPTPPPANSIRVRFSKVDENGTSDEPEATTVQRLEVLPDEEHPVLAYRGLESGAKVAVFELSGNVLVEGDGECLPTPQDCQSLKLRAGETAFVTVTDTGEETDAQYQLDLVKINGKGKAKASSSKLEKADDSRLRTFKVRH